MDDRHVRSRRNRPFLAVRGALAAGAIACSGSAALAATVVPTEVQAPGTQPGQVSVEVPTRCGNCHAGYAPEVEPYHNWMGSMMAHASRDPVFWAALAVAEQDFDGSGDLCIRCHVPQGWMGGRSTPTNGAALQAADAYGVSCDLCHTMTNPDRSEHLGVQTAPFIANDGLTPAEGYYGSGEYVLWGGSDKLGPYSDAVARHQAKQSLFHRSPELCGTCHDVSNPVTGDLAHNHGAQAPLPAGSYSGVPGAPVTEKAAFNNPPYAYGVVERTYSEFVASALGNIRVADYPVLPSELQDGAIAEAYFAATAAGGNGDYADGAPRFFTCQTCHLQPVTGQGCNKNPPVRTDLPLHDLTGGNYWAPDAINYLDGLGKLVLGGGLTAQDRTAMAAGQLRARGHLQQAASLSVLGDVVRVVNLTGHKLISGYPEGRRMWLNIRWYDSASQLVHEDGAYGPLSVTVNGSPMTIHTLLDLSGANTRIYEVHGAVTQEWANQLLSMGKSPTTPLRFDRTTGQITTTLGDLAAAAPGAYATTFHFILNNHVSSDNRIPPFGMSFTEAQIRNALPVPSTQFGNPLPGGVYDHWDELTLSPPAGATWATIDLLYQPMSWEYVQFLHLANDGSIANLAATGADLLEAWQATGMAEPQVMASELWGAPPSGGCAATESPEATCGDGLDGDCDGLVDCADPDCAASAACLPQTICGNGACEAGESCTTCLADCPGVTSGSQSKRYCCGNGVAEPLEGNGAICDGNY